MSLNLIHNEVRRFLLSSTPEVICIRGKWGVGKTYTWNYFLVEAISNGQVALGNYSYVSLFGLRTLNELKYAMFEGTVKMAQAKAGPDVSSLVQNFKWAKRNFRKIGGFLTKLPFFQSYLGTSESSLFFSVRNQIICIDDLERLGGEISVRDVLGMISFLKEQRKCKVVLLLNYEELPEDDREVFDKQLEKVADTVFDFLPDPVDAAKIVFGERSGTARVLADNCIKLGIVNIRVVKKIERIGLRLEEILKVEFPDVIFNALHSAALFGWAVYQPNDAPAIDFIENYNAFTSRDKKDEMPESERSWQSILYAYGYSETDSFDLEILKGIQAGFFDDSTLLEMASKKNVQIQNAKHGKSFDEAWALYHDSFEDNQEAFLDQLYASAINTAAIVHPTNMNGSVEMLREFGRTEQCEALISHYVSVNPKIMEGYDPRGFLFKHFKDPGLLAAFQQKIISHQPQRKLEDTLSQIGKNHSFCQEDLDFLSGFSKEDFIDLFSRIKGMEKNNAIDGILWLKSQEENDEKVKPIAENAFGSLQDIARTSKLNARRMAFFGVKAD